MGHGEESDEQMTEDARQWRVAGLVRCYGARDLGEHGRSCKSSIDSCLLEPRCPL